MHVVEIPVALVSPSPIKVGSSLGTKKLIVLPQSKIWIATLDIAPLEIPRELLD